MREITYKTFVGPSRKSDKKGKEKEKKKRLVKKVWQLQSVLSYMQTQYLFLLKKCYLIVGTKVFWYQKVSAYLNKDKFLLR